MLEEALLYARPKAPESVVTEQLCHLVRNADPQVTTQP